MQREYATQQAINVPTPACARTQAALRFHILNAHRAHTPGFKHRVSRTGQCFGPELLQNVHYYSARSDI